jgi:hypothetical protein
MLTAEEINKLGNIIDTTWGKSSTPLRPTMSLKASLVKDNQLQIVFTSLGTFASDRAMSQQTAHLENDSIKATDAYLKDVKDQFKEETGRTLKTKIISSQPWTEIVSLQPHISPRRTAYYRRTTVLEVT